MKWNWQTKEWPKYSYSKGELDPLEHKFIRAVGEFTGVYRCLSESEQNDVRLELATDEACSTSSIEGIHLSRASVRESLRGELGLATASVRAEPKEKGMARLLADAISQYDQPLSQDMLFNWHSLITAGDPTVDIKGDYRQNADDDPMQVVTSRLDRDPIVHYEAPPTSRLQKEMNAFIKWYNNTAPGGSTPLAALERSSIAHHYFLSIHPFEDGNGRTARALSHKALSQSIEAPCIFSLSKTIEANRRDYYTELEASNKTMEASSWMKYFSLTQITAQLDAGLDVDFIIGKTKYFDQFRDVLNERQNKVVARMFREGRKGFLGGMTAGKYSTIAQCGSATATRDLAKLVSADALKSTGVNKGRRYWLPVHQQDRIVEPIKKRPVSSKSKEKAELDNCS